MRGCLTAATADIVLAARDVQSLEESRLSRQRVARAAHGHTETGPPESALRVPNAKGRGTARTLVAVQAAHVREKEMKRQTLLELVDYVNTGTGKFTEYVSEDIIFMLSVRAPLPVFISARHASPWVLGPR